MGEMLNKFEEFCISIMLCVAGIITLFLAYTLFASYDTWPFLLSGICLIIGGIAGCFVISLLESNRVIMVCSIWAISLGMTLITWSVYFKSPSIFWGILFVILGGIGIIAIVWYKIATKHKIRGKEEYNQTIKRRTILQSENQEENHI